MTNQQYASYVKNREKRTPCFRNTAIAFVSGGIVCIIGRAFCDLYSYFGAEKIMASALSSVTLIFIAGLLTGIGCFDKLAHYCAAGLLVPITGFSNAVASQAIEAKSEGFVMGVGAEMFKIAGPVIVFGNAFACIYGLIYYITGLF